MEREQNAVFVEQSNFLKRTLLLSICRIEIESVKNPEEHNTYVPKAANFPQNIWLIVKLLIIFFS